MRKMSLNLNEFVNKVKGNIDYSLIILITAIICYIAILSYVTIMRHWAYYSAYMDLGWFEQAFWSTINGHFLYVSYIDASHFGTHNSPILFLFRIKLTINDN